MVLINNINYKMVGILHIIFKFFYKIKYKLVIFINSVQNDKFDKKNNFKSHSDKVIIGFITKKSSGWILQYTFNDLSKYALNYDFELCHNFNEVYEAISKYRFFHIFSLHPSFLRRLYLYAIPSRKITTFYTHSRSNNLNLFLAKKIHKILPMNSFESNLLELEGIKKENMQVFYAGYDHNIFYPYFKKEKKFDVIFVGKYNSNLESYYSKRKNYYMLIKLVNSLSVSSIKVAILGNGWEKCQYLINSDNVSILDPKHSDYAEIYNDSKIFVNLSKYEGGPVSWLESMACGCITISSPTGFSLDFFSDDLKSFLIPINSTLEELENYIKSILKRYTPLDKVVMQKRIKILKKTRFQTLTCELEKIADLDI